VGGFDDEHETHLWNSFWGEPRTPSPLHCLADEVDEPARRGSTCALNKNRTGAQSTIRE